METALGEMNCGQAVPSPNRIKDLRVSSCVDSRWPIRYPIGLYGWHYVEYERHAGTHVSSLNALHLNFALCGFQL